jgi:hypothetical protein
MSHELDAILEKMKLGAFVTELVVIEDLKNLVQSLFVLVNIRTSSR